jgi:ParB family transcriptional regulator, chromosome partitioning protein
MNTKPEFPTLTITLDKLRPGHEYPGESVNSRKVDREEGIEELGRSLLPNNDGQLKPILTCQHPSKPGVYFAFDGNRRYAAFAWLMGEKMIAKDHPIEIKDYDAISPHSALRLSWAANEQKPLHPADRYQVFAQMQVAGKTTKQIAEDRGMTVRAVEQSLAFGSKLASEILDSWRAGEITQDLAKIFTLGDFEDQVDQLEKLRKEHRRWHGSTSGAPLGEMYQVENKLRSALTGNEAAAARLLKFVGEDAYIADGGRIVQDLFGEKPTSVVQDISKLKKLAKQKLQARADKMTAEGWSWVEVSLSPNFNSWNYGTSKDKAKAGCVIRIAGTKIEVKSGLTKKKDEPKKAASGAPRSEPDFGYEARNAISSARDQAAGLALHRDPDLALAVFLASTVDWQAPISGADSFVRNNSSITHAKTFKAALAEFRKLDKESLIKVIVQVICEAIDLGDADDGAVDPTFISAIDQDIYEREMPKHLDVKAFFSGTSKPYMLKVIEEALGPDQKRQNESKDKAALAKFCIASVVPTGWLPKQLRGKSYKAPDPKRAGAELGNAAKNKVAA